MAASIRLRPLVRAANIPDIPLARGESKVLGRSDQADVMIDEPSLSRLHARVHVTFDGVVTVEDLGSTNGIFINNSQREGGSLSSGDRVRFGSVEYELEKERAADEGAGADHTVLRMPVAEQASKAIDRAALEGLLATSRELMAFSDLPGLLDRVLERLQAILKPDRSAILLVNPETGELIPRAVRPTRAVSSVSEFASGTAVREALAAREVLVVYDARIDARFQQSASLQMAGVRSVMCVPLFGRSGAIGALYADQLATRGFTTDQVQYASAFAAQIASALETAQLYEDRQKYFRASLEAFAKFVDARDKYTAGHSERVTAYTLVLARTLGLPAEELEIVRRAGMLHDVGKVGVPDAILLKPGPLDPAERVIMESHTTIGFGMLKDLEFLKDSLPSVRGHHERYDGRGYPDKLAAGDIHQHARLMGVADSYDAMTSARPYRNALTIEEAGKRVRRDRGAQFDPQAVDIFDVVEKEFIEIHETWFPTVKTAQ
ncbi:MAG: HD domain-containing phosphohydrolase [Vicinamibacterales bacterium]